MRSLLQQLVYLPCLLFLISCGGSGSGVSTSTIQGQASNSLQFESQGFVSVTNASVAVVGRQDLGATIDTSSTTLSFTISDVPDEERLVFSVTGGNIQQTLSFPLQPTSGTTSLGFIGALAFTNLKTIATDQGLTIDDNDGIVIGVVSEAQRTALGGSTPVVLIDVDGQTATADGPFFFTVNSNSILGLELTNSVSSLNSNGRYVFFNVAEGNYTVTFRSSSGIVDASDVVVPAASLVIGQDIP